MEQMGQIKKNIMTYEGLKKLEDELQELKVNLCMNCGSCTFVCPANRKLAETNQLAKTLLPRK